jgi:hypothetical protein
MALDKLAELFAIFVAHVDEFDPATIGADIPDDGGEIDPAQARANLEFNGIANSEFPRRL